MQSGPKLSNAVRVGYGSKLTFVNLAEGTRAELFNDLEATLQNFLSVLQHIEFLLLISIIKQLRIQILALL